MKIWDRICFAELCMCLLLIRCSWQPSVLRFLSSTHCYGVFAGLEWYFHWFLFRDAKIFITTATVERCSRYFWMESNKTKLELNLLIKREQAVGFGIDIGSVSFYSLLDEYLNPHGNAISIAMDVQRLASHHCTAPACSSAQMLRLELWPEEPFSKEVENFALQALRSELTTAGTRREIWRQIILAKKDRSITMEQGKRERGGKGCIAAFHRVSNNF